MKHTEIAKFIDHTLLKADASSEDIRRICHEALEYQFWGVCVNPCMITTAKDTLGSKENSPKVVTVIGFPLGANTMTSKIFETLNAKDLGADEIDMVIPVGSYLGGAGEKRICAEIEAIANAAGSLPLKVILETGFLTSEQIYQLSQWSAKSGAAFVKTSTGFGSRGASIEDIRIMARAITDLGHSSTKIKASGGIKDLRFFEQLIEAGASRIGCSASVKICKEFLGHKTAENKRFSPDQY